MSLVNKQKMPTSINKTPQWAALRAHYERDNAYTIQQRFDEDAKRSEKFSMQLGNLWLDYSRHFISSQTLELLVQLAEVAGLDEWRQRLFSGQSIHTSEQYAPTHYRWRNPKLRHQPSDASSYTEVMDFAEAVRRGKYCGASGLPFKHILNIGIGGSYNGVKLLYEALAATLDVAVKVHFVEPTNEYEIKRLCASLPPEQTLCVVVSKSFSTPEVLRALHIVSNWLQQHYGDNNKVAQHQIAVSANLQAMLDCGFNKQRCLVIPAGVGGRYSVWSVATLSVIIAIGRKHYEAFLDGGYEVDTHFMQQAMLSNVPVLLGLINLWYVNFYATQSRALLSYEPALKHWTVYVQQLEMESNGKFVRYDGTPCDYATAPVIWGGDGLHSQHTFFQLLHQGTLLIPCEFIIAANSTRLEFGNATYGNLLFSNFLAQIHALAMGGHINQGGTQTSFSGNRPSTVILLRDMSAATLGALIALYEHQVFVQATVWGVNPYDQWGVELGKELSRSIQVDKIFTETVSPSLLPSPTHDASLLAQYKKWRA